MKTLQQLMNRTFSKKRPNKLHQQILMSIQNDHTS